MSDYTDRTITIQREDAGMFSVTATVTTQPDSLPIMLTGGNINGQLYLSWSEWDEVVEHVSHVSHLRTQNAPDPADEDTSYRMCGRPHPTHREFGCVLHTDHRDMTIDHCDPYGHRW
jgi:hypothetical protein